MPNDEYFEARNFDMLAWTQVFLDYPPQFLGVIGMLATQAGFRSGKPGRSRAWIQQAQTFTQAGYSPMLYALVCERIAQTQRTSRALNPDVWAMLPRAIDSGLRITEAIDVLATSGREALERRMLALRSNHE